MVKLLSVVVGMCWCSLILMFEVFSLFRFWQWLQIVCSLLCLLCCMVLVMLLLIRVWVLLVLIRLFSWMWQQFMFRLVLVYGDSIMLKFMFLVCLGFNVLLLMVKKVGFCCEFGMFGLCGLIMLLQVMLVLLEFFDSDGVWKFFDVEVCISRKLSGCQCRLIFGENVLLKLLQ